MDNPTAKSTDPKAAADAALLRISELQASHPSAIHIYTDATSRDNSTAWAAVVQTEPTVTLGGRLPDYTPITLSETTALYNALLWCARLTEPPPAVFVHTDSLAAVNLLASATLNTYPEILTAIIDLATRLQARDCLVTFHWIPSHVDIPGNDAADAAAAHSLESANFDPTEHTPGAFGHLIRAFIDQLEVIQLTSLSPTKLDWYRGSTVTGSHLVTPRHLDIQLRRLRMRLYTYHFAHQRASLCSACCAPYTPEHFLLECPEHYELRTNIRDVIPIELTTCSLKEQAQFILRRAQLSKELLIPLLEKTSYHFQW